MIVREYTRSTSCLAQALPVVLSASLFGCSGSESTPTAETTGGYRNEGGQSSVGTASSNGGASSLDTTIRGGSTTGVTSGVSGSAGSANLGGTAGVISGGTDGAGRSATAAGDSGVGGSKPSGGARSSGTGGSTTGGAATIGGTRAVGGSLATGGSPESGGKGATGGAKSTGGAKATGGAKSTGNATPSGGVSSTAGSGAVGGSSGVISTGCPYTGHVSYKLTTAPNPTAEQQNAYSLIKTAMDKALVYYNCYTDITKSLNISYVPSVSTADGNINGSIRFGSNTTYMDYRTAMHEISHTVGVGTTSEWASCIDNTSKLYTCTNAKQQLADINSQLKTPVYTELHADTQHFWPYGINQQSEVKSEADLVFHCQMVMAILKDIR